MGELTSASSRDKLTGMSSRESAHKKEPQERGSRPTGWVLRPEHSARPRDSRIILQFFFFLTLSRRRGRGSKSARIDDELARAACEIATQQQHNDSHDNGHSRERKPTMIRSRAERRLTRRPEGDHSIDRVHKNERKSSQGRADVQKTRRGGTCRDAHRDEPPPTSAG